MVGSQTERETEMGRGDQSEPLRVIVVDDDPFARRMIKESLRRAGIVIVADAHNGRQAVELALFYRPDLILMDVVMPELDGISATREILKDRPDQLIVMLTSSDEEEMGIVGLRAGAVGYLSKDVDVDVLAAGPRGRARRPGGDLATAVDEADRAIAARARADDRHAPGQEPADRP